MDDKEIKFEEPKPKKKRGRPKGSKSKKTKEKVKKLPEPIETIDELNDSIKFEMPKLVRQTNKLDVEADPNIDKFNLNTPTGSDIEVEEDEEAQRSSILRRIAEKIQSMRQINEPEEDKEPTANYDFQRQRLKNIAMRNPKVLTDKLDCDVLRKINKMSDEEIEQRLYFAERFHSNEFDKRVGSSVLNVLNMGVGRFLDCYDELKDQTDKHEELNSIVLQQIGGYLDYIPPNLKGMLLYGSAVGNAYMEKQKKKICTVVENTRKEFPDTDKL